MIKFTIDKNTFTSSFLQPISKISERCVIGLSGDSATCLIADNSCPLSLYCEAKIKLDTEEKIHLNIGDVYKLERAISCIEEDTPTFELKQNHIIYKSKELKFKYHLLEDGVMKRPTIDVNALNNIKVDTSFNISKNTFNQLLRNSSFTHDSNKVYISTTNDGVLAELTDKTIPNIDSIEMKVCDSFSGTPINPPEPLRLDWLRTFASIKTEFINVRYNKQNHIVIFYMTTENATLQYIVSTLTK